jgi:hypothetical protein
MISLVAVEVILVIIVHLPSKGDCRKISTRFALVGLLFSSLSMFIDYYASARIFV